MSELQDMLVDVVDKMLKARVKKETVDLLEKGQWAEQLWYDIVAQQLHLVAVSEAQGGAGGDFEDLLALYDVLARHAAPIPFIEHTLAHYVAQQAGLPLAERRTTYSVTTPLVLVDDRVSGTLANVAWGMEAKQLVAFARQEEHYFLVALGCEQLQRTSTKNIAAEPRAHIHVQQSVIESKEAISAELYEQLIAYVSAASVAKMNGAISVACELAIQFSREREQFGRPIHRFQLVQQHIAQLVGEQVLADVALARLKQQQATRRADVGYARIRMEEAIRLVATSAHQVHAAMGVTYEHRLQHYTRRLWAWRDEDFTASYWKQQLAEQMAASTTTLWTQLTEGGK